MNALCSFPAVLPGRRIFSLLAICCLLLALGACAKDGAKPGAQATNPNLKQAAYGITLTTPPDWKVINRVDPQSTTRASLDTRRKSGERILLLEAAGPPSPRGLESMIGIFLVNEEGTFMPRDFAEKLQPHEFSAMSRDLMDREKAEAKKKKAQSGLLDLQVLRDDIGGKLAISQRMLVAGPDGKPVRLMNWDLYLPNGAGLSIRSVCDPEAPGAETEIINTVMSLRVE